MVVSGIQDGPSNVLVVPVPFKIGGDHQAQTDHANCQTGRCIVCIAKRTDMDYLKPRGAHPLRTIAADKGARAAAALALSAIAAAELLSDRGVRAGPQPAMEAWVAAGGPWQVSIHGIAGHTVACVDHIVKEGYLVWCMTAVHGVFDAPGTFPSVKARQAANDALTRLVSSGRGYSSGYGRIVSLRD